MRPARPRPVLPGDPVAAFDCGIDALNTWLAGRALRNERTGDSRTYISIDLDTGDIAGYYSLAAWSVSHDEIGGGWLLRNAPDPVSVVLLGRLAVSVDAQGIGLGRDLLADALANAQAGARVLGARALVAEAINEDAERFYTHAGLWRSKVRHDLFAARLNR
ncbi:GNAT family N-acetyltransferase [Tessaracoccus caeni]|uniref:GNAT family N-acetyltransferase n=1 Tax=Tessaracoccus caeni TaxID=3031239 RepID=UPI0023DACD02|nr:GNAT family N-acetyltransferase [Tessaracoccus caeni]MDF1489890.1 GNAT family N-acetyltransferase [Tessaracoccus caeni]